MNTQQRTHALTKFIEYLDSNPSHGSHRIEEEISELDLNEEHLPKLDSVEELMEYHQDITGTIEQTYRDVRDIMVHMKELKNRKKNVQIMIDCMTSIVEVKKLSYGLGTEARQIHNNLETYYSIRNKVYYMDKFIDRIEKQIMEIEKEYQNIFDTQITKNNSNNIAEISKVLQLIRKHTHQSSTPDTLQQIKEFCLSNAKKQFKKIEEDLFAVPIVGNSESNYLFFDMAKTAMKIIATLSSNCKNNVVKVSGQDGLIIILKSLFELVTNGIILQLLMRLRKYYQIDKIVINQNKFALREKEFKLLQPYFKEFIAIWNQLERLKIHLLAEVNDTCNKKNELKLAFQNVMNNTHFIEINGNAITFMQAMMRHRFDKLLKVSTFVIGVCGLQSEFFKDVNSKNIVHNSHVQDFLEQTINRISEGIEKALQTLNTLIISAIINFANHNLIYEDVFFAFRQLFSRTFNRLPSNDSKVQNGVLLSLNALAAFPRALKTLIQINFPEQIPETRMRAELQQVVNNNEEKANAVLYQLLNKIVTAEWFRVQLTKDYEKILDKWNGLETQSFHKFVQCICRVHAEIILQTEFAKRYTQVSAINFQKEVRSIISFYERVSHSILPHFKPILDYIEILLLEGEEDLKMLIRRYEGVHTQEELRRVWSLRTQQR